MIEQGIKEEMFPELHLELILETLSMKEKSLFLSFCRLQGLCGVRQSEELKW